MATNFEPRDTRCLVYLDVNDRRRLAEAEFLELADRKGELPSPLEHGQVVLHNAVDEEDLIQLGDKLMRALHRRFAH